MFEALGKQVSRLMRVRYGGVVLPRDLMPGEWRELERAESRCCSAGPRSRPPRDRAAVVRRAK